MKCSFCGKEILAGTGKIFVWKEGKTHFFCSSKCEKNLLKLKRNPLARKWTARATSEKKSGKERGLKKENKAGAKKPKKGEEGRKEKLEEKKEGQEKPGAEKEARKGRRKKPKKG